MKHFTNLTQPHRLPAKAQNLLAKELWIRNAREGANATAAWLSVAESLVGKFE